LHFGSGLENVIRQIQENEEALKLNGTHRLPVYADVDLLGENVDTIKKNTEALLDSLVSP
jgi:hypothetical protein